MQSDQPAKPYSAKWKTYWRKAKNSGNGGKARGEQKKRQKTFREALETLLSKEVVDKNGDKYDLLTAISAKQVEKASKGDTKAFEVIRDTIGQKPVERVEITEWDTKIAGEIEAYVDGRKA